MPTSEATAGNAPTERGDLRRDAAVPWRVALLAYWILLFVGTHLPSAEAVVGPLIAYDKPIHFVGSFVLATLMLRAFRGASNLGWRSYLAIAVIALAYAAADELTQPLVNRSCDLYDWVADAAGVATAIAGDRWRNQR